MATPYLLRLIEAGLHGHLGEWNFNKADMHARKCHPVRAHFRRERAWDHGEALITRLFEKDSPVTRQMKRARASRVSPEQA